ncbi:MAG TPA: PspC domain-containing protein [Actinopolymorphaceae bacterium]
MPWEETILTDPRAGTTTTDAFDPTSGAHEAPGAVPRCVRRTDGKILGGVAGGLADHLCLRPLHVRLAFVVLTMVGGFGLLLYAALWVVLPQGVAEESESAPGLAAATRQDLRRPRQRPERRADPGQIVSIVALTVGLIAIYPMVGGLPAHVFWPLILGGAGLALLWRQADDSQRARWTASAPPRRKWLWPLVTTRGRVMVLRTIVGVAFVVAALSWGLATVGGLNEVRAALLAILGAGLGIGLIIWPWVWRLVHDLSAERAARIRSEERADMAAHLHDSVLQTLALIQKQAHDPRAVVRLARAQERDLRQWLYGQQGDTDATLRSELGRAGAEVEDQHEIPVEVVVVGDAPMDPTLTAVVRAAREAMVNAAKHSGAPRIDVYAEVSEERVEVFVRDRGAGFDLDQIGDDRLGLRHSVCERMERHGGKADIRTSPGEGTEVRLYVERAGAREQSRTEG